MTMNGSATLISNDDKEDKIDEVSPKKSSVKASLMSSFQGMFSSSYNYISWSEFVSVYLRSGNVDRLEVGHDGWAKVILKSDKNKDTNSDDAKSKRTKDISDDDSYSSWFWSQLNHFKVPSMPSWEFDDVSSVASSNISDTESIDDDHENNPPVVENVGDKVEEPAAQKSDGKSKIYLQIGRPSYLERNLKLAYQQLNIPVANYLHIVYTDRKHLGTSSNGLLTALFSLFLTILPIIIILRIGRDLKGGGSGSEGGLVGGLTDFITGGTAVKAEVNPDIINVTFKDVAGCDEAKIEILEFVNFLKHPQNYVELGAKVPHGAILYGPPGTGKTLLAKAAAKEAGVPFLSQSGSEFTELFVGMGPLRMRSLFSSARAKAPCIVFIDEIDAIGRKRGGKYQGSNNEEENTLNQLLSEMDGFKTGASVIVLGATNRLDILDPALLRPGRFDRHIEVTLPDIKGRAKIFKVHLKGIKTEGNNTTELARHLAALTHGFSGAEIANVCNEAALIAARFAANNVTLDHFKAAMERVVAGLEKRTRILQPEERKRVAYHEAGHAVAGWFLKFANPLLKVSIIPRGRGLGYALYQPEEKFLFTKEALLDTMCMTLGGRAAELIFFGDFSTGAQDDLRKVTDSAYGQILRYGMNEKVGHVSFDLSESMVKPYSEATGKLVDEEVRNMIQEAMDRTMKVLNDKKDLIEKLAEVLLEKEVLEREDMVVVLGERPWAEKTSYDDFVAGAGGKDDIDNDDDEDVLPAGLVSWNADVVKDDNREDITNDTDDNVDEGSTDMDDVNADVPLDPKPQAEL